MNIRFGTYTIYNDIEMSISEYYGHGLDQEFEKNHRVISYPKEYGQLNGFNFDVASNAFKKDILVKDLNNAYSAITKALYKGMSFFVQSDPKEGYVGLNSNESSNFEKIGYERYQINDEKKVNEDQLYNSKYFKVHNGFIIRVNIKELDEIWEERTKSKYNLPMPEGIEIKKIIKHRNII